MKAVNESTWTFQMIIFFMLIFACFLTLILKYNKAYIIKNRVLSIVEKYEGVTSTSSELINDFIYNKSYETYGKCPDGWVGALNLNGDYELAKEGSKYLYCYYKNEKNNLVYYDIKVFFKFSLPVIGTIGNWEINGTTQPFIGATDEMKVS